jgi:hypothetical protein
VRILFTLTLFLSSALLFLIQPMVGKIILPAFGGSPAVWTTTMVFFQAALLGGYAYAHFSTSRLGAKKQSLIHVPLMILALLTLPFATHVSGGATGSRSPLFSVLWALLSLVGAVFFIVSAGAPLLQRWFASTDDPDGKDPYFLYSASNLGSMIALLAYPILVEPRFKLSEQTRLWAYGYGLLVLLMGVAAFALHQRARPVEEIHEEATATPPLQPAQRAMWVMLGAVPSSLLLGVTAYLTTNIAPIPLLWVVPLALYLLTFILAFARRPFMKSAWLARVFPLVITPLALAMILESTTPIVPLAIFHLLAFFIAAWMCHSRLSESRPAPKHLTEFYLWISVGGVLGGLFNAAVAPVIFSTLMEYPLALVLASFLRPPRRPEDSAFKRWDGYYPVIVGFLTIALTAMVKTGYPFKFLLMEPGTERTILSIGLPAVLCFLAVDRPRRFALSLGAMFAAAFAMHTAAVGSVIYTARSFFGVHRIVSQRHGQLHTLVHGTTVHGMQDSTRPTEPLTYYSRSGPIGHVFKEFSGAQTKPHVAFVGLGVGTVAAYGVPGQTMTFFEIDPVVEATATNPKFFTFLRDSKAKVDIVLGDARLTLADQPNSRFGLLVLDAFSSDAIPVHLLTEEAFQLYLKKLDPHGIIAVHISNRYLNLDPVLYAIAKDLHLATLIDEDEGKSEKETNNDEYASVWVIMARDKADFAGLNKDVAFSELNPLTKTQAWTDDFSNVLGVFKRNTD